MPDIIHLSTLLSFQQTHSTANNNEGREMEIESPDDKGGGEFSIFARWIYALFSGAEQIDAVYMKQQNPIQANEKGATKYHSLNPNDGVSNA